MAWVRLDSKIYDRPDFIELRTNSKLLFIAGVCHLSEHRLGETLPIPALIDLQVDTGLSKRQIDAAAFELVGSGLWTPTVDGYFVKGRGSFWKPGGALINGRLPIHLWLPLRLSIFKRDDYTCRYCGARGVRLECDHVVPVSRGGSNDPDNLVTACKRCNRTKAARLVEEWI